jgi:hypothetical protein
MSTFNYELGRIKPSELERFEDGKFIVELDNSSSASRFVFHAISLSGNLGLCHEDVAEMSDVMGIVIGGGRLLIGPDGNEDPCVDLMGKSSFYGGVPFQVAHPLAELISEKYGGAQFLVRTQFEDTSPHYRELEELGFTQEAHCEQQSKQIKEFYGR